MDDATRRRIVELYYLFATPAFWLADILFDAPLRASFIPYAPARWAYYAACIGCGVWMKKRPSLTRPIGMAESAVNFTMTLLSIWVPMMNAFDSIASGPVGAEPTLDPLLPINAGISGLFTLLSYYSHQDQAAA
jgi:hypothetical protein